MRPVNESYRFSNIDASLMPSFKLIGIAATNYVNLF